MRASSASWIAVGLGLSLGLGCGALRQNLRNQFVSYRGAWSCAQPGCGEGEVVQSKAGATKGDLRINDVTLREHAALVFYPGVEVQSMTASVRDCKGKSKAVPADKVQAPGKHAIGSEPESWVVWLDRTLVSDLTVGAGDCAVLVVKTHSVWDDGSEFDVEGAVRIGG